MEDQPANCGLGVCYGVEYVTGVDKLTSFRICISPGVCGPQDLVTQARQLDLIWFARAAGGGFQLFSDFTELVTLTLWDKNRPAISNIMQLKLILSASKYTLFSNNLYLVLTSHPAFAVSS